MGIITLGARFGARPLRCGILGSFMGRPACRAKAGLRLSRATFALDVDVMFSDTASVTSVDLSRAFGFHLLPCHSLTWLKVLRPCGAANAALRRSAPVLGASFAPAARWTDALAKHLSFAALPAEDPAGALARPVTSAAFAEQGRRLLDRLLFRPAWDDAEFSWLIDQAAQKSRDGALHAREVVDRKDRIIGLFLLYARPGGIARALQVLTERDREAVVLAALIREAAALGASAVRGQASPAVIGGLIRHRGIIYRSGAATIAFARDKDVGQALRSDAVLLGGLFGESWTRLMADDFT